MFGENVEELLFLIDRQVLHIRGDPDADQTDMAVVAPDLRGHRRLRLGGDERADDGLGVGDVGQLLQVGGECVELLGVRLEPVVGVHHHRRRTAGLLLHDLREVLLQLAGRGTRVGAGQIEVLRELGFERADEAGHDDEGKQPGRDHPPFVPEREPAEPEEQ